MTDQLADDELEGEPADPAPAAARAPSGWIVMPSGDRIELTADTSVVGRLVGCTIVVPDRNTSRRHAMIRRTGGRFVIIDLGSTNGTSVNGERVIADRILIDDDIITIGAVSLRFVAAPNEAADAPADPSPTPTAGADTAEPAGTTDTDTDTAVDTAVDTDTDTETDTDTDTAVDTAVDTDTDTETDTDTDTDTGTDTETDTDSADSGAARSGRGRRLRRRARISKWDRPPNPRDWRFFVGMLGRGMIATGLLMFAFVAYQLWGTGIETARAQSSLKSNFEQLVAEQQPEIVTDLPTSDTVAEVAPAPDTVTTPALEPSPDAESITATQVLEPVVQNIPPINRGEPLALLEIPAIGRSDIVVPGVEVNDLKDGPGHYPTTPLPGQLGNAAIAGHRTTYGAPFFDVDKLQPGDDIIVTMLTGDRFVYVVTGSQIVGANDGWVVNTTDPTIAELTLTSCDPKYTARDRIVIHSVLDQTRSAPVGLRSDPYDLDGGGEQQPAGDDPVVTTSVTTATPDTSLPADAPAVAAEPEPDPADPVDAGVTDSTTVPAREIADAPSAPDYEVATVPAPTEPTEVGDAFTEGWFDDHAAFPQIALWGLILTIISLAAYRISRRFRHDSIGFLIGIGPFLIALYFFFQNINRLLPPGV